MRPQDYRRVGYKKSVKQNNFYNGSLKMSMLNNIDKITIQDVYKEQKEGALNYHSTRAIEKFLSKINYDIQHQAESLATMALSSSNLETTNQLNKDLDQVIQSYSPEIKKETIQAKTSKELIALAQSTAAHYQTILSHVYQGTMMSGMINSHQLLSLLQSCESKINALILASQNKDPLALSSNFYAIYYTLNKIRGYALEEEAVKKLNEAFPTNIRFISTGSLQVGGSLPQGGADIMGFDITKNIQITWEQAPINSSSSRVSHTGSLAEFLDMQSYMRGIHTFYVSEDTYQILMKNSLVSIQAKGLGTFTKNIKMVDSFKPFEASSTTTTDGRTIPTVSFKLKQYQSKYTRALEKMRSLYELSAQEERGQSNYLNYHIHYRMLLNLELSKMFPWIMKNNDLILTPRHGLMSLVNLFRTHLNTYFYYGPPSSKGLTAMDLSKLENYSQAIFLRLSA